MPFYFLVGNRLVEYSDGTRVENVANISEKYR